MLGDGGFRESLAALGLAQYHDQFVAEAFDCWPVLAEITEKDLDALGVRLGHRRILQKAIADYQQSQGVPVVTTKQSDESTSSYGPMVATSDGVRKAQKMKRKYTRHPKTDRNAPVPPPTGYVLFSNWVRNGLRDQKFDFPEIAKIVGHKWQALPKTEKDIFLNEAKDLKTRYLRQMTEYKRTPQYREYQRYLADFKSKNVGIMSKQMSCSSDEKSEDVDDGRSRSASMTEHYSERYIVESPRGSLMHGLPSMRVAEHDSPRAIEPMVSLPGHVQYGWVPYPPSPESDRCMQPPLNSRQLPPLVQTFR